MILSTKLNSVPEYKDNLLLEPTICSVPANTLMNDQINTILGHEVSFFFNVDEHIQNDLYSAILRSTAILKVAFL